MPLLQHLLRLPLAASEGQSADRTDALGYDFMLRSPANLRIERVGAEREPVVVINGVMRNPAALVDYAAAEGRFEPAGKGAYPGLRSPAPLDYVGTLVRALDPLIRQAFSLDEVVLAAADCSLSIVTEPPENLTPLQRVPHVDTDYPLQFAVLHYLCGAGFGGTGFYRHSATGYETLSPERTARFETVRDRELAERSPPAGYIGEKPENYISTASFEAAFDRLLIYRSCVLHCGLIPVDMPLVADPRHGRLTSNIFVSYRRR